MNITATKKSGETIYNISGRLDTITAPKLDETLSNDNEAEKYRKSGISKFAYATCKAYIFSQPHQLTKSQK